MTATLTLLATLARPPERGFFTLAGVQCANVRGELRETHFYHRLVQPREFPYQPGEALHVTADIAPDPQNNGRVRLRPVHLSSCGALPTKRDARENHVLLGAVNMAVACGRLARDIEVGEFEDGELVANTSLILRPDVGLLEVTTYGLTAGGMQGGRRGDPALLSGRLVNETRESRDGKRTYTRLETWRQSLA